MTNRAAALVSLTLAWVILGAPQRALASANYPDAIRDRVGGRASPPCTVCHTTSTGGAGTATTDLARYLVSKGLKSGDLAALGAALDAARDEGHDTDGDGKTDLDELRDGDDPNEPPAAPRTLPSNDDGGCSVHAGAACGDTFGVVLAAFAAAVVARRRRVRSLGR